MAVLEPYKHGYFLWKYVPSIAAAVLFAIIFFFVTVAYLWRIWTRKTWFVIPMAAGGYMQFIGYVCRAAAHDRTGKLMPFVMSNNNILLAPVLYAATIYMTLGRVVLATGGERHSPIRAKWLTALFVSGDILALAVQGAGAGMSVVQEMAQIAQGIIIAGLVIQLVIFGIFWATSALFHTRMRRDYIHTSQKEDWEGIMWMLYGVSGLIMLRSVFRLIEFIQGMDGYLLSTEWPLYIFDTIPMLMVMAAFWWWYPSLGKSQHRTSAFSLTSQGK